MRWRSSGMRAGYLNGIMGDTTGPLIGATSWRRFRSTSSLSLKWSRHSSCIEESTHWAATTATWSRKSCWCFSVFGRRALTCCTPSLWELANLHLTRSLISCQSFPCDKCCLNHCWLFIIPCSKWPISQLLFTFKYHICTCQRIPNMCFLLITGLIEIL